MPPQAPIRASPSGLLAAAGAELTYAGALELGVCQELLERLDGLRVRAPAVPCSLSGKSSAGSGPATTKYPRGLLDGALAFVQAVATDEYFTVGKVTTRSRR